MAGCCHLRQFFKDCVHLCGRTDWRSREGVGDVQLLAKDMYNLVSEAIQSQAESEDSEREGVEGLCSQKWNEGLVVSLDHYGLPQDVIREFLASPCSYEGILLDLGVATFCGCRGSGSIGGRSPLRLRHLEQDGTEPVRSGIS